MSDLWGLRVLALAVAVLLWFFVTADTLEPQSVKVIDAPVSYDSPGGFVILEPLDKVKVTVRGAASRVRNLNPFLVDVFVRPPEARKGIFEITLGPSNVALPGDLEVVSIEPNLIRLELDREETGMLSVQPRLVGEPAAGALVIGPTVEPPMAVVRGPASRLALAGNLTTSPVSLDGHALDFQERAMVISEDPLIKIVDPAIVTVRIELEIPTAGGSGAF